MSKKYILIIIGTIFTIALIIVGVILIMKYNELMKQKEFYYKQQQERITLYLKHNTKEPNTIKSVHFTSLDKGPLDERIIEGYINNNKDDGFVAYMVPAYNHQFGGDMLRGETVQKLLKPSKDRKSPDQIKKELEEKRSK
ncbi:DUF1433 domain-containing protein [Staphylococcus sp. SS87]|nr:DUF1433 domain-containing protein [Staphylococcus singaporensis]